MTPTGILYNVIEFVLIIFFSFFYTALVYNPDELADNMKKSGGHIPGVAPGPQNLRIFQLYLNAHWLGWRHISGDSGPFA